MKCGVRFCGGCNPRFNRRAVLEEIERRLKDIDFVIAVEGVPHDLLLVIGGCTNCCASYEQFDTKQGVLKIWDQDHIDSICDELEKKKNS